MQVFFISLLAGVITFFLLNIIENLILGNRGRDNQISNYYKYIKGNTSTENKNKLKFVNVNKNKNAADKIYILYGAIAYICIFSITYLVFSSIGLALFMGGIGLAFPKAIKNNRIRKKKEIVNLQLKDALSSIVSSLKAGLSINSALTKCSDDLEKLYSLIKYKPMLDEFYKIKNDLNLGMSVEEALKNFMERMKLEDVDDFVNSVIIVREKGGNLVEVMESVSKIIDDKIQMRREINTLTTSKRFEANIMTMVPIFMIFALSVLSRNYMQPLFESFAGKVLIIIGFSFLAINYFISKKIVDIDI